jgi:tetratricopeptide (TPR) repeat protein
MTGDSTEAGDFLLNQGIHYRFASQHEKSVQYCKLAIDQYKHQYGDGNIPIVIKTVTDEMVKLNKTNEAFSYLNELYENYPPQNLNDSIAWMKALGEFYRQSKQYKTAEEYISKELSLLDKSKKADFDAYHLVGQFYVESGNYAKAKVYLDKALSLADSTVSMRALGHLHYCLFVADSARGDYLSAIKHLAKNKRYDDSVLKESNKLPFKNI